VYWIARHLHPVRPLVVMVPTVQIAASVVATAFSHADHDTLEGKLESWPDGLASVTKKSTVTIAMEYDSMCIPCLTCHASLRVL
jgi:hypothetical protein